MAERAAVMLRDFRQVVGPLGVGPAGPIEPLAGRDIDHPPSGLPGDLGRDRRGISLGLARHQAGEVGAEPTTGWYGE